MRAYIAKVIIDCHDSDQKIDTSIILSLDKPGKIFILNPQCKMPKVEGFTISINNAKWQLTDIRCMDDKSFRTLHENLIIPYVRLKNKVQVIFWRFEANSETTKSHQSTIILECLYRKVEQLANKNIKKVWLKLSGNDQEMIDNLSGSSFTLQNLRSELLQKELTKDKIINPITSNTKQIENNNHTTLSQNIHIGTNQHWKIISNSLKSNIIPKNTKNKQPQSGEFKEKKFDLTSQLRIPQTDVIHEPHEECISQKKMYENIITSSFTAVRKLDSFLREKASILTIPKPLHPKKKWLGRSILELNSGDSNSRRNTCLNMSSSKVPLHPRHRLLRQLKEKTKNQTSRENGLNQTAHELKLIIASNPEICLENDGKYKNGLNTKKYEHTELTSTSIPAIDGENDKERITNENILVNSSASMYQQSNCFHSDEKALNVYKENGNNSIDSSAKTKCPDKKELNSKQLLNECKENIVQPQPSLFKLDWCDSSNIKKEKCDKFKFNFRVVLHDCLSNQQGIRSNREMENYKQRVLYPYWFDACKLQQLAVTSRRKDRLRQIQPPGNGKIEQPIRNTLETFAVCITKALLVFHQCGPTHVFYIRFVKCQK